MIVAVLPWLLPRTAGVAAAVTVLGYMAVCVWLAWECGARKQRFALLMAIGICVVVAHVSIAGRMGRRYARGTASAIEVGGCCAIVMLLPACSIVYSSARRRAWRMPRNLHLCACGYDLRGNVSRICPECGEIVSDDVMRILEASSVFVVSRSSADCVVQLDQWRIGSLEVGRRVGDINEFAEYRDTGGEISLYEHGVTLWIDEERGLEGFTLILRGMWGFRPFAGSIVWKGARLSDVSTMSESAIHDALGEPYWRFEGDTLSLFYEFGEFEIVIVLGAESTHEYRPDYLVVNHPPLLSDVKEREYYGVTAAWPPDADDGVSTT